ncbi:hypothetical protein DRN50_02685 [Thermococci archaeon]|nr:MAG: hypothetical protein DRN50_02685 [Thermococci archaeon]
MKKEFKKRKIGFINFILEMIIIIFYVPKFLAIYLSPDKFDPKLREGIMIAISEVNDCKVCQYIHKGFGRSVGLTEEEIRLLGQAGEIPFTGRDAEAVFYARAVAEDKHEVAEEILHKWKLSEPKRWRESVIAIVKIFNWINRGGNCMDAFKSRLRGEISFWGNGFFLSDLIVGIISKIIVMPMLFLSWWKEYRKKKNILN